MHDSSPAVRDAAIELVGKYAVSRPDLASEYLPQICERITAGRFLARRIDLALTALYYTTGHWTQRSSSSRQATQSAVLGRPA